MTEDVEDTGTSDSIIPGYGTNGTNGKEVAEVTKYLPDQKLV